MRIAHIITYIARDFGGPVIAMAAMVDGLIDSGEQVAVFSVHHEREGVPVDLPQKADPTLCHDLSWGGCAIRLIFGRRSTRPTQL